MPVPPPVVVPPPPDPALLSPLEYTWPAGHDIVRCYNIHYGAREFYAGSASFRSRFSPFVPAGASGGVSVLYGADGSLGALSESVFHDVPVRGVKQVPYAKLLHRALIRLRPTRDLRLVDLTSDGLSRLELERLELIESDPRSYQATAEWARALHEYRTAPPYDGLCWVSRQRDTSMALVLFGDRVLPDDLVIPDDAYVQTLAVGSGLEAVCVLAARAAITITGLP